MLTQIKSYFQMLSIIKRDLPSKSEGKLLSFSYETQIFEQRRKTSMMSKRD